MVIYAGAYLAERTPADRARFIALILFFMTAMLGAVLADDLIVLFVFWEATSVLSFLLIGFDVDSPSARRSALMSLRVTAGGGLALLAAILLIGATLGSYSLTAPSRGHRSWRGVRGSCRSSAVFFVGAFTNRRSSRFTSGCRTPCRRPRPPRRICTRRRW